MPDAITWDDVPIDHYHSWEITVTQDAVNAYCDGAEDYNPWYGPGDSPFGWPLVPPMLISRLCRFTLAPLGKMTGWVQLSHRNVIVAPVAVGSHLRFLGAVADKATRDERGLVHLNASVYDMANSEVFAQSSSYLCQRRLVDE